MVNFERYGIKLVTYVNVLSQHSHGGTEKKQWNTSGQPIHRQNLKCLLSEYKSDCANNMSKFYRNSTYTLLPVLLPNVTNYKQEYYQVFRIT